jgi:hypothetical protein
LLYHQILVSKFSVAKQNIIQRKENVKQAIFICINYVFLI